MTNPLIDDRVLDLLLTDVLDVDALCGRPPFDGVDAESARLFIDGARRVARELLFPDYRAIDREPPTFDGARVRVHPRMHVHWKTLKDMGFIGASRPEEVGGGGLPLVVTAAAYAYLMAGNLSALSFIGLTSGAAHLIESFGDDTLKERFMRPMVAGDMAGTMALTEPQAGSGLADVATRATPHDDGTFRISGSKIFISAGDHDLTDDIVHLVLARIDGAPAGTKGISLFAVPTRVERDGALVGNGVTVTGNLHKIGWRGVPSLALDFGGDAPCTGFLVGEAGKGLTCMFQLMNEARVMVGLHAAATSSVAYHEALAYARERRQGRALTERDPTTPPVRLVEHADVRRMLLRQKSIVDASLSLSLTAAWLADRARAAETESERARAALLLDTLTPVVKSWPAELGFESCALAVQVHGGYGYTSEYLPEAFLRDQKLNTIHEGTSGIQGMDLLGRKLVAQGGEATRVLVESIVDDVERARRDGASPVVLDAVKREALALGEVVAALGARALAGDIPSMMRHSASMLEFTSLVVVGWMHVRALGAAERRALSRAKRQETTRALTDDDVVHGVRAVSDYFVATDLPRAAPLRALILSGEESFSSMRDAWF